MVAELPLVLMCPKPAGGCNVPYIHLVAILVLITSLVGEVNAEYQGGKIRGRVNYRWMVSLATAEFKPLYMC